MKFQTGPVPWRAKRETGKAGCSRMASGGFNNQTNLPSRPVLSATGGISTPACQNLNCSHRGLNEAQSRVPSRWSLQHLTVSRLPHWNNAYCKNGEQREPSWVWNGVRSLDGQGPALRSTSGHVLSLTSSNTHPANTLPLYTCKLPRILPRTHAYTPTLHTHPYSCLSTWKAAFLC